MNRPIRIFTVSFDWRNLFETNLKEIFEKLERDGLASEYNNIFSLNWSTKNYYKKVNEHIETLHLNAYLGRRRFWYDFINIFIVPLVIKKYAFVPDVVIVRDFPSVFSAVFAKLVWRSKIVLILTNIPTQVIRTRPFWQLLFLYQIVTEFFAKYFIDYAIAISSTTKGYFEKLSIPEKKIRVFAPNVIKRDQKFISVAQKDLIRSRYGISKDKKIILSVGRLEPEKNFHTLIKAFHDFQDKNFILIIVGEGRLRTQLEDLVASLCLKDRVILTGSVERDDIWNFYRDADVFVLLSKSEGLGLVFWEAMYSKVPVIGLAVEGVAETIGNDGLRGFFWDDGANVRILEEKLIACCERGNAVSEIITRAKTYVEEKIESQESINQLLS